MVPDLPRPFPAQNRIARTGKRYRIFLVDDHAVVLEGLCELINACGDFSVCGQVRSADAAMLEVAKARPDAIILDISLGESCGLTLIEKLQDVVPCVPVVVVTMHDESSYGLRALRAGASGYIMKSQSIDQLVNALRAAVRGRLYISEALKQEVDRLRIA